uniref:Neur_chan_LBD domain-containing protein n=1 Tax=Heligmosomoides polygyrus TaxID=6339 RepID=A0A183FBF7_HELPZ
LDTSDGPFGYLRITLHWEHGRERCTTSAESICSLSIQERFTTRPSPSTTNRLLNIPIGFRTFN